MHEFMGFFRSLWVAWLMILFVGVVAWAYWPRNRGRFDEAAMIPLSDDPPADKG